MNKHIELVKKWLENNESVSSEELQANKKAAAATYAAYADADSAGTAYAAVYAAAAKAYHAAYHAADAEYWVKQYEERTK